MIENFKYGNISETGSAGTVNEDYYGCFDTPNGKVFVLCDGTSNPIGGHVASKTAVEAIREYYNTSSYNNLIISLHNALVHANNAVLWKIAESPELQGMSTTCLIVIIKENKVYYADIGDTRLYCYRNGKCMVISGGHSAVSTQVSANGNLPDHNTINALGTGTVINPHICNEPMLPEAGDLLLLCSAGLTSEIAENFSTPIVYKKTQDLQMRVADLVKLADKNHTADNTTLQLIEFSTGDNKVLGPPVNLNTAEKIVINRVAEGSGKGPVVLPIILLLLIAGVIYFGINQFKKEDKAVTPTSEVKADTGITKAGNIITETFEDSSLSSAQFQAEAAKNQYPSLRNSPQLPPVNTDMYTESGISENIENPLPSPGRIPSGSGEARIPAGSGEAYVYTLQPKDDINTLKKKFGKSWEQLKGADHDYTDAIPIAGKDIKIYGYIFFASGSETERNENIENALKSSPGMQRSDIIIVPGGILIP